VRPRLPRQHKLSQPRPNLQILQDTPKLNPPQTHTTQVVIFNSVNERSHRAPSLAVTIMHSKKKSLSPASDESNQTTSLA
jgi:hypothetical protein